MSELRSVSVCGRRLRTYYGEALELPRPTPRRLWDAGSPPPIALVVDFRRRAADVDGLARLERQMGPGHPSRSAVLQGLAESLDRQGAQIAAARAYRRWGREFPDEKYADFHEARCLLAAGSGRAIAPLRRFLAGHSNPKYAAHVVAQLLSAPPAGTALVIRALRRAVPPLVRLPITVHHLRVSVDRISSPSERSRLKRELMTVASRDVAPLVRLRATANEGGHLPPALERALADLLLLSVRLGHGRARVRLLGLIPVERLRAGLAMYQIASLLKDGSSGDRDVAKGLFATLSRRRSLSVGLRSGACFHLGSACQGRQPAAPGPRLRSKMPGVGYGPCCRPSACQPAGAIMTPTTATPTATIHHTPTEVFRRLSSPCCRSPIHCARRPTTDVHVLRARVPDRIVWPGSAPAGTDDDGTFAEWRDVQSALAAWRAQTWDGSADARARSDETARLAGEFLARAKPAGELLDIGCGSGWIEPLVAARGASYAGIDPAPCAPRYDFPFVRALSDRLPFEASSFDACLFSSSLDYSVDVERTLGEVTRVLRPAAYSPSPRRFTPRRRRPARGCTTIDSCKGSSSRS